MGRYGVKERNAEGLLVMDFEKRMEMAVVNMCTKKKVEHVHIRVEEGPIGKQLETARSSRKNVLRQHQLVCRMTLETKKRKQVKAEPSITWIKLKKEDGIQVGVETNSGW